MILLTGCAGFIGYHTALALLAAGRDVLGIDNLNDYYDGTLKSARLAQLTGCKGFAFERRDIAGPDFPEAMRPRLAEITHIVHLAAQAGVRYSLTHPMAYGHSNLTGHLHMLELARAAPQLRHFLYASSSSVYGETGGGEQRVADRTDAPLSLYAATKKAGELMAHSYAHLYGLPATGLRFFTVYGPWGRPDMAYYSFALAMREKRPITVFGKGELRRDFTYIDDIVAGIAALLDLPPDGQRLLNLGHHHPESVNKLVGLLEANLGLKANIQYAPREAADVAVTFADIAATRALCGYDPKIALDEGIARFAAWFRDRHP